MGRAAYRRDDREREKEEKLYKNVASGLIPLDALISRIEKRVRTEERKKAFNSIDTDTYYVFFMAFGLALKEKLPNWGTKVLGEVVQNIMTWIDRYEDWGCDMERLQNEFCMTYGEQFEFVGLDDLEG